MIQSVRTRAGHDCYVAALSGDRGYQARCTDCTWAGVVYLRDGEDNQMQMTKAQRDVVRHQHDTRAM